MRICIAIAFWLLASTLLAQVDVSHSIVNAVKAEPSAIILQSDTGPIIIGPTKPARPVALVSVVTGEAGGAKVRAFRSIFERIDLTYSKEADKYILDAPAGEYAIWAETATDFEIHRVVIPASVSDPVKPDDPVKPTDPPPVVQSPLEKICRDALAGVTDPQKSSIVESLAAAWDAEAVLIESGSYSDVPAMMEGIKRRQREILGDSRPAWEGWRLAIANGLAANQPPPGDVKPFAVHWKAIARGLRSVSSAKGGK